MSALILKLIAMTTMLIDHVGLVFFPKLRWLRLIGRVSFPLYAFMIAEGFEHTEQTGHTRKYALRLAALFLLSELPYDFGLYAAVPRLDHTNVILTLLCGLLMLAGIERVKPVYMKIGIIALAAFAAELSHASYGYAGVLLILLYHLYLRHVKEKSTGLRLAALLGIGALFAGYYLCTNAHSMDPHVVYRVFRRFTWTQTGVLVSAPLLTLYNGKKGRYSPVFKWVYRLFYPLHLSVFSLMRIL
ncbi:MAG: hypothetical protein IKG46_04785 [Solobacterium sp.]|nr:hypothetical protein [Solobacterium sp.]